ncbi:MAG: tetratricopeptide repeat protein [Candidatus Rokubacteria bacterium]|nr:tetratricopeptide repeat protein [Candidatus Rokubacteria bacterium]
MRLSDEACGQARALIASRLGLDFGENRRADLERGLLNACRRSSVASGPEAYLAWLASLPDQSAEWRRLASHLTVGETYFFRDHALFEALEQRVLPSLIEARRSEAILRLRLWSAGCATGEEPYSLAILLDRLLPDCSEWVLTILATDINPNALDVARRGLYREWSFRDTPQWIRDRYVHRRGAETFEVDPRIRRMVTVAPLNLAEDGYPSVVTNTSAMDVILCRNVLMYFTPEAQRGTVARLHRALVSGGWLAVSPAEASAELFRPLAPVNYPGAMLYRKESGSVPSLLPGWAAETVVSEAPAPSLSPCAPSGLVTPPSPVASLSEPPEGLPRMGTDLQRARALADQGKLEEARELCEAALSRDRLAPEPHLLLAAICQERGEIPAAVEALRRVIYLVPDSAPAHFLLGSLLLRQGQRQRARRSMETVVSLLSSAPRDEAVAGGDGLTAGRLVETARAYLELR